MKNKIRPYFLFAPLWYRIIFLVMIPAILFGIYVLFTEVMSAPFYMISAGLYVWMEIFGDYWVLNGIHQKNSFAMEYIKSSPKGRSIMKAVIMMDIIRRVVWASGFVGIMFLYAALRTTVEGCTIEIGIMLVVFLTTSIGLLITRHLDNFQINMLIASIIVFLAGLAIIAVYLGGIMVVAFLGISSVIFSFFSYWYTNKKVEDGYYDERLKV